MPDFPYTSFRPPPEKPFFGTPVAATTFLPFDPPRGLPPWLTRKHLSGCSGPRLPQYPSRLLRRPS